MRLMIAAVGRLKTGAERELFERYHDRVKRGGRAAGLSDIALVELGESRAATSDLRRADEAVRLMSAVGESVHIVALDEKGKSVTSTAFAELVRQQRDSGAKCLALLIGGPDGHGPAVRDAAHKTLSLGPMTLPHGLARIVLAEQLYRTTTILTGHPYHRG